MRASEPKEKAEQLVERFMPHAHCYYHDLTPAYKNEEERRENAIVIALIHVDNILDESLSDERTEYYNEVKKELEKL